MRREYFNSGSDIPEGCVSWLPLAYEGDLTERVTGQQLQFTGNGSMVWDSTEGMYKLTAPATQYQYVAYLQYDGFQSNFNDTDGYTYLYDVYGCKDGQSGVMYCGVSLHATADNDSANVFGPMYYPPGTGGAHKWPGSRFKMAYWHNSSGRGMYIGGTSVASFSAYAPYNPSQWSYAENPNLLVGYAVSSTKCSMQLRLKNVMIFNRVLTQAEIKYYQGIE